MPLGIAAWSTKRSGRGQDALDDVAPPGEPSGSPRPPAPARRSELACRGLRISNPLFQNLEGRGQNSFDLLGGENFQRRPTVGEPRQRR